MDTLNFPLPNQLYLVVAPHAARVHMLDLAARLALCGSVRILDAGNQCNIYPIAQRLRQATHDVNAALQRIQIQRAFTCYQVATLLVEARPASTATLVLDFLSTFYDQDVKLPEATRLLRGCLNDLLRLAEQAPVLVSARVPLAACAERQPLLELLRAAAAQRWEMDEAQPVAGPPSLFLEAAGGGGICLSPFSAGRLPENGEKAVLPPASQTSRSRSREPRELSDEKEPPCTRRFKGGPAGFIHRQHRVSRVARPKVRKNFFSLLSAACRQKSRLHRWGLRQLTAQEFPHLREVLPPLSRGGRGDSSSIYPAGDEERDLREGE